MRLKWFKGCPTVAGQYVARYDGQFYLVHFGENAAGPFEAKWRVYVRPDDNCDGLTWVRERADYIVWYGPLPTVKVAARKTRTLPPES